MPENGVDTADATDGMCHLTDYAAHVLTPLFNSYADSVLCLPHYSGLFSCPRTGTDNAILADFRNLL